MMSDEFDFISACMIASTVIWRNKLKEVSRKRRTFLFKKNSLKFKGGKKK